MLYEVVVSFVFVQFVFNLLIPLFTIIWSYTVGKSFCSHRKKLKRAGEWAVITGGCSGIGYGYAQQLAQDGLNLMLISNNDNTLNEAAENIKLRYGVEVKTHVCDFTKTDIYDDLKEKIYALPSIACLVNNAGMFYPKGFHFDVGKDLVSLDYCRRVIQCNMTGVALMTRLVLPKMLKQSGQGAVVINMSSVSGMYLVPYAALYASSKSFILRFSEGLRKELKHTNIFVQAVCPGRVATKMIGVEIAKWNIPDPFTFAGSALDLLGVEHVTNGYFVHAIMRMVTEWFPLGIRKQLLKKSLNEWSQH